MAVYAQDALNRYRVIQRRNIERDQRMRAVHLVRTGRAAEVFRGLFPEEWPAPVIANTIDIAAQDTAEMVGVLPTLAAYGDSTLDESRRSRADKLTKIINAYVYESELGRTLIRAADHLVTYGFCALRVEFNYATGKPFIHADDSMGSYVERDRFLNVTAYARTWRRLASELAALYPEHRDKFVKATGWDTDTSDQWVEVVQWFESDGTVLLMLPDFGGLVIDSYQHPLGRVPVAVAARPTLDGEARGSYDDALWVWAARARLALLSLEATQKAVEAPIALPNDVQEFALGPDALIRSQNPERIRRVALDLPQSALITDRSLENEVRDASRFPEVRTGNTDASVVTGRGIQALMGGFDSRIKVFQSVLGSALSDVLSMALEVDERVSGDIVKEIQGSNSGSPYTIRYNPARDIKGNYGVSFEHGVMAGLDPNRALVWSLQALGAGLTSKSFVRRNLPVSMNISEEERVIDVEKLRESLMSSVQAYAQAIPQIAANGGDPSEIVTVIAGLVDARKKGTTIEDAAMKAFPAPPPPPQIPTETPGMPSEPSPLGGQPPMDMGGGGAPAPMSELLSALSGNTGRATMSARTVRAVPA